jgi:hypothetical protein
VLDYPVPRRPYSEVVLLKELGPELDNFPGKKTLKIGLNLRCNGEIKKSLTYAAGS